MSATVLAFINSPLKNSEGIDKPTDENTGTQVAEWPYHVAIIICFHICLKSETILALLHSKVPGIKWVLSK